jgi:TPR repeat protein
MARAAFEDGRARLLATRQRDRLEPLEPALTRLRAAASAGHLEAQVLLGTTMFDVMFDRELPQHGQDAIYVEAIGWLRIAAMARDPDASAFLPGLTLAAPLVDEIPLNVIPIEWLEEAWQWSDAWLACHGLPWRSS